MSETDSNRENNVTKDHKNKLQKLEYQVGGHDSSDPKCADTNLGMYDLGNGLVLKALLPPPRGPREMEFYQQVFNPDCVDPDVLELRQFIPQFHGIEEQGNTTLLKMTNLTSAFRKPCIIDLKIGPITYDQEASARKIHEEVSKFPPVKVIGFRITGMMIQNQHEKKLFDKYYGRELTEENVLSDGLCLFLSVLKYDAKKSVIQGILARLRKIEKWFLKQKKFSFIASSLLIIYEGLHGKSLGTLLTDENADLNCNNNRTICPDIHSSKSSEVSSCCTTTDDQLKLENRKRSHGNANDNDDYNKEDCHHKIMKGDKTTDLSERVQSSSDVFCGNSTNPTKNLLTSTADDVKSAAFSVHLIDFAHVFPASDTDENFLFGLQKLISYLSQILN